MSEAIDTQIQQDAALIADLGGPSQLAERLGYDKQGGAQRVQNWITRGIPAKVKVDHPEIFLLRRPITEKAAA